VGTRNKLIPLEAGARAPQFRLPRLDSGETSLAEIVTAGMALLAFFKISCPVCQLAFPFLERLHQPGTLPVYGISQNNARDTREFAKRYGVTFPVLLDLESTGFPVSNAYGPTNVPTLFLIEPDGSIAQTIHGWNKQKMTALGATSGVSVFRSGDNVPEWKAG
jgi:cytochrome c biogenesis protein CcmG, thiol:disulfide interchange protein DsbE